MKINLNEHQVYMNGEDGPFKCSNCAFFISKNYCANHKIIKLAREDKFGLEMKEPFAIIDPNGCSDYFEPR